MHVHLLGCRRFIRSTSSKGHVAKAYAAPASSQSREQLGLQDFEWDLSAVHSYRARKVYIESIRHGEAVADLARAAVAAAAEDDAIATHSTVPFPQAAYLKRIDRLAADCQARVCAELPANCSPADAAACIQDFLQLSQKYTVVPSGRSNLPEDSVVDHPGVWEDAKDAYLTDVLIRKTGHASAVAVLMNEVFRKLFEAKAIDFLVTVNCGSYDEFPQAVPLPLPRTALLLTGSMNAPVNTCSIDTLHEMLTHHKRAFWPFAWDTGRYYAPLVRPLSGLSEPTSSTDSNPSSRDSIPGQGPSGPQKRSGHSLGSFAGFMGAASEAVHGPASSYIQAVSRAARNRLQTGIWTSPGGGDIRRAVAASERLVLLTSSCKSSFSGSTEGEKSGVCGCLEALERRDLGVLYLHAGILAEAKVELLAFQRSRVRHRHSMELAKDEDDMMDELMRFVGDVDVAGLEPLTVELWLQQKEPNLDELEKLPLTW